MSLSCHKKILFSVLAPLSKGSEFYLKDSAGAVELLGCTATLWGTQYTSTFSASYLPMCWDLSQWDGYFSDYSQDKHCFEALERQKWIERIGLLTKQDRAQRTNEELFEGVLRYSQLILEFIRPSHFFAWNQLCPHTGVLADICRFEGIPVSLIERAMFPDSWYMDTGGLIGHHSLAGSELEDVLEERDVDYYSKKGVNFLHQIESKEWNNYGQKQNSEALRYLNRISRGMRILFLPPDDTTLGYFPVDHDDRRKSLPGFANSLDAAKQLSQRSDGIVVFKPHPSFSQEYLSGLEESESLRIVDVDFHLLVDWADVVVTSGSGLAFYAMQKGKPVIQMANDLLAGKGICHEALFPEQIPSALRAAFAEGYNAERKHRFQAYVGYLLAHSFPSFYEGGLDPSKAVGRFLSGGEQGSPLPAMALSVYRSNERTLVLERDMASVLPEKVRVVSRSDLGNMSFAEYEHIYIDFDHTLYAGNSTEDFITAAKRGALGYFLLSNLERTLDFLVQSNIQLARTKRDTLRVWAVLHLLPWEYRKWKKCAGERARDAIHLVFLEKLAKHPSKTVLSNGFEKVIRPLLDSIGFDGQMIASTPERDIRSIGKAAVIESYQRDGKFVFITDSLDDENALLVANRGILVQRAIQKHAEIFRPGYLPFRYVVDVKYRGKNIFLGQFVAEDLVVLLLAFSTSINAMLAVPLLWLSIFCIYEIGYYENDTKASDAKEKIGLGNYTGYAIWQSWPWAIASSFIGILILPLSILWIFAWILLLIVLRITFHMFNRINPSRRIYLFPFLQFAKSFSPVALLPLNPWGAVLLTAQIFRQTTNYIIYRNGGDTSRFRRQAHRLMIFVLLSIVLLLSGYQRGLLHVSFPFWFLMAGWCLMRVYFECYGQSFASRVSGKTFGLLKCIIGLVRS